MQSIIDILATGREDARRWLADNRADDGYADISNSDWELSLAVINGVELDKIRLADRIIFPNFVDCRLSKSEFLNLTTEGHFWGGGNEWQGCTFSTSSLRSLISPQNVFVGCTFKDVVFDGYVACETLFESCRFLNCKFESVQTKPKRRTRWTIGRMAKLGSSLQFVGCEFDHPEFLHCVFADSAFSESKFVDPVATDCDFTNIKADRNWWPDSAQSDVFVSYLDHVMAEIAGQLGPGSRAVQALSSYKMSYLRGDNTSKDYSACLYNGSVPDREMDVVEDIIDRISPRFGM